MSRGKNQIRLVTFKDWDIFYKWPWYKSVKWTDDNKIGYVTDDEKVIYPFLRGWKSVSLKDLRVSRTMTVDVDPSLAKNVQKFFTDNVPNRELFYAGLNAILHPEDQSKIFENPIKLPVLTAISGAERDARWSQMTKIIKTGDYVFCIDTSSMISRSIAKFDHGSWSHTAWYVGGGYVFEAIPKYGVCARHMELYNRQNYRVGIYRPQLTDAQVKDIFEFNARELGASYAYAAVIALGIRKLLGLRSKFPKVTPNEFAIHLNCPIVHIV